MRKLNEFEIGNGASLNGRYERKSRIGIPKKARVSTFRVESDLTRANRAHAKAMGGRIYEDIPREAKLVVARPKSNAKRVCQRCANRVYGLGRQPTACPQCGIRFDREGALNSQPCQPAAAASPGLKWR
jgi:hypothetical protein